MLFRLYWLIYNVFYNDCDNICDNAVIAKGNSFDGIKVLVVILSITGFPIFDNSL